MVEHHTGALEIALAERSSGEYADAKASAREVAASQAKESDQMKARLAR